jgi:hypothetical protein
VWLFGAYHLHWAAVSGGFDAVFQVVSDFALAQVSFSVWFDDGGFSVSFNLKLKDLWAVCLAVSAAYASVSVYGYPQSVFTRLFFVGKDVIVSGFKFCEMRTHDSSLDLSIRRQI